MSIDKSLKERLIINNKHKVKGVEFIDINLAYIDENVIIGAGTVIYPMVFLEGATEIGEDCLLGMNSRLVSTKLGNRVEIENSVILESEIKDKTKVGPFAYIRPGSVIGSNCKIGDFVEVKNSTLGNDTKVSHLSYIGDSDLEENINIGCGVVFVNYDGTKKYRSTIRRDAFIGCNSNIISPIEIEEGAYIAAGSTVTRDVSQGSLYIDRGDGKILEGWAEKKGIISKRNKGEKR
ncbi:MAG: DapH/DapD/GlmU-related protein [Anaerovoracaceae bacterium]